MADRKQTPDILADLLNGGTPGDTLPAGPTNTPAHPRPAASKPRSKPAARPATTRAETKTSASPVGWEHQTASFQEHNGWRLRYVDGKSSADWPGGLKLHEYIAEMQANGWQVAAACHGAAMFGNLDKYQVIFKRPC